MSQVGVTAFALMFTAVQVRWALTRRTDPDASPLDGNESALGSPEAEAEAGDLQADDDLARTRLGKLAAATALLELLVVTLVSTALYADPESWMWRAVALAATLAGLAATGMHIVEFRRRVRSGHLPTPADLFQHGVWWLPLGSYSLLGISAVLSYGGLAGSLNPLGGWDGWLRGVLVWLLISGLIEVYVTLSPHLLEAEPSLAPRGRLTDSGTRFAEFIAPQGGERRIAVVFLPDMWGLSPSLIDLGARLCRLGHPVCVVDYYTGRRGGPFARKLLTLCSKKYAAARVAQYSGDALAVRSWGIEHRGWQGAAVVGFSIGGAAALREPESWSGVAAFYPSEPVFAARLPGASTPLFLAWGSRDRKAEKRLHERIQNEFTGHAPELIHKYGNARHGFMGTGRGAWLPVRLFGCGVFGPDPLQATRARHDLATFLLRIQVPPTAALDTDPIAVPVGQDVERSED